MKLTSWGGGLSRDVKHCNRVSKFCDGIAMLRQTTMLGGALPSKKYFLTCTSFVYILSVCIYNM